MLVLPFVVTLLIQFIEGRSQHHKHSRRPQNHHDQSISKKSYVIEVQDHQQALKYANPIVDLEDTVRRGISDPLADPRFVMNRINSDFFGNPTSNGLSDELADYHGHPMASMRPHEAGGSVIGVNREALGGSHFPGVETGARKDTPSRPTSAFNGGTAMQHNQGQAQQMPALSNLPINNALGGRSAMQDLQRLAQLMQRQTVQQNSNLQSLLKQPVNENTPSGLQHSTGGSLSSLSSFQLRSLLQQQQNSNKLQQQLHARQLQQLKQQQQLNNLRQQLALRQLLAAQKQQIATKPTAKKIQTLNGLQAYGLRSNPVNQQHFARLPEQIHLPGSLPSASDIDSLTGLPSNLEDRSYGGITSVENVETNPGPQLPSTITINTGTGGTESSSETSSVPDKMDGAAAKSKDENHLNTDAATEAASNNGGQQDNFGALKSFLEADDILRDKLDKDGMKFEESNKEMNHNKKESVPGLLEALKQSSLSNQMAKENKS